MRTLTRPAVAVVVAALSLAAGCSKSHSSLTGDESGSMSDFDRFSRSMTGTFSNAEQAKERDKAGKPIWMNVVLHIVEIHPPAGLDSAVGAAPYSRWFYIEQGEVGALDRPYRQHISVVHATSDGGFSSQVYTFTGDPLRFTGWWKHPESFSTNISAQDLDEQEGCESAVRPTGDGGFTGGTIGTGCPNTSKGASYATSQLTITPGEIRAWDRGFDAAGRQVWGSTTGPYIFKKQ